jgi:hypothetical protein
MKSLILDWTKDICLKIGLDLASCGQTEQDQAKTGQDRIKASNFVAQFLFRFYALINI